MITPVEIRRQEVRKIMRYKTKGTCSSFIDIEMDGDIIKSVAFTGGCNGNLQGISRLVEGMHAKDAISGSEASAADSSQHPARISWLSPWNPWLRMMHPHRKQEIRTRI